MNYQETYDDMRELTDDVFQLLRKLQTTVGKQELVIEIDVKRLELSVYDDSDKS